MRRFQKILFMALFFTIISSMMICSSTLLLHEIGHFLLGFLAGCKNIKLVLLDSELGTYTEMHCATQQNIFFPLTGAFILVLPFLLSLLIFKNLPEKNLIWIGLGFNLTIAIIDFPQIPVLQISIFSIGFSLIIYGEIIFIDKVLSFIRGFHDIS